MTTKVNLDALISREDFYVAPDAAQSQFVQTIQIRDLERNSFFYAVLRKPDFQRETADWSPEKVFDFVQSFLNGDLIPAIILWNSGSYNFVIDGAHRLSALISWVHDDYGDGDISKMFFAGIIPPEQQSVAEETRNLIKKKLGSYKDHKFAIEHPSKSDSNIIARAMRLGSLALQLQWVQGDANKAEDSFFKINQQAAPIEQTELRLLKSRRNPNALAARAIIRSGTGHKYWSKFSEENQETIEEIAKEINNILFTPTLRTPIKTLDLPVAGKGYSSQTLPLIFELVNIVNDVKSDKQIQTDNDGSDTIRYLKNTRRIVYRISGSHPSSLGLHPAVYFYGATGRYQPTTFLAIVGLLKNFDNKNFFKTFTEYRNTFETFWLKYKNFANQVTYQSGSGVKGFEKLQNLYETIIDMIIAGKNEDEILESLRNIPKFNFLKPVEIESTENRKDFSGEVKSAAFLREALASALRCKICQGLIHANSISIDHVTRKEDGGIGSIDNAQLTHPYCNTTFKN